MKAGNKVIGVNFPAKDQDKVAEIEKRAESLHMSTSRYIKEVMCRWLESGEQIVLREQ